MVNKTQHRTSASPTSTRLPAAAILVRAYLVVVAATLVTLTVLAPTAPRLATPDAWGHAVVVAVFAILLPLRLRRAQAGNRGAIRAVGLIAGVLVVVNLVEALIPGFVPVWMRVQMVLVALLMIGVVLDVIRGTVVNKN